MVRRFREPNKALGLCELSGSIASVVRLSGFDKIIPVHRSLDDAVAAISSQVDFDKVVGAKEDEGSKRSRDRPGLSGSAWANDRRRYDRRLTSADCRTSVPSRKFAC